jgi:hypothetical protein
MSGLENGPKFTLFNELPKEIRLLIWEHALPGPRIVYLQRHVLRSYDTSRVWSDKSIEDFDDQGRPTFFDMPWEGSSDEDMSYEEGLEDYWDFGRCHLPFGFRSQSLPPSLIYVCQESLEVAERFYTKAFGDNFSFPQTWFDYEMDTLYLDWGWHDVSGVPFVAADLGDVASEVKHLAIYNSPDDSQSRGMEGPEERLCRILLEFGSLETLTLVNRRHKPDEKTSDLVFMNPMDLLIWQPVRESNTADIDITIFDEWMAEWLKEEEGKIPMVIDLTPPLEHFRRKWAQDRIPPWNLPKITRKIITTACMRDLLEMIAGGPGQVKKLSVLSASWINEISRDPVSAFTSVDFTPSQQRQYMDAIVATFPESLVRSIEDET